MIPSRAKRNKYSYCSRECWKLAKVTSVTIPCEVCGLEISRSPYQLKNNKRSYCSRECTDIGKVTKELVKCNTCGIKFKKFPSTLKDNNYCSNKCSRLGSRKPEEELSNRSRTHKDKLWAIKVKEQDDFTCQKCGKVGGVLRSHHIVGYADSKDLRLDVDNGVCLCEECHTGFHRGYGYTKFNRKDFIEFMEQGDKDFS